MLERIYFVHRKLALSVFTLLFMGYFLILSCETGEVLNFTPNKEGLCLRVMLAAAPMRWMIAVLMKCEQLANARWAVMLITG